ncbi:hypothetical protein KSF_035700 [Reticulibacter mediterranei]|uniref:Gas vesicle protein GvpG n=1 Tax=Reticulibacter mediterranei TaxID=2778369 RepID=A0A8J3ILM7_9CHLR|nr:gas vesicle protein GvpG [Reticulibacter mediterranei]GHO93522.1 hypothetical protein KSF_035700 [Reticulibacter mediterranei]
MFILDDLLFKLPAKGFMGIFKKIAEMAEEELNDTSRIKEELLQLEFLFETDQITEEEYQEKEAAIMERLNVLEEQQEDITLRS